jgi:hypothetical protein
MGRFHKLLSATAGIDGVPEIRTKAILRRELLEVAAKFRQSFDESVKNGQIKLDSNSNADDIFKKALHDHLVKQYATPSDSHPALIDAKTLDAEVNEWIGAI